MSNLGPTGAQLNNTQTLMGLHESIRNAASATEQVLSQTIGTTDQLVNAVTSLSNGVNNVNSGFSQVTQATQNMSNALSNTSGASRMTNSLSQLTNALGSTSNMSGNLGTNLLALGQKVGILRPVINKALPLIGKVTKWIAKFAASVEIGSKFLGVFTASFNKVKDALRVGMFFLEGFYNINKKIIELTAGLPLRIAEYTSEIGGVFRKETSEVFDQLAQNMKENFDERSSLGQTFKKSLDEGKESLIDFYKLDSTFKKVYGYGSDGLTNLMNQSNELILQLGANLNFFGPIIGKSIKARDVFVRMTKTLGLTAEGVETLGIYARSTGQGIVQLGLDIKNTIDDAARKFSVDAKQISGTFFNLRGDFINFGHMTDEALSDTVAQLTQMGVQVNDISAVFSKFDTFESAAQSAALLSQTFGMNVDALRLIQAESPAEIFNELTSALYNTGRSFSDLNRHERALMAQYTGLSGKTLQAVMNYTEAGMNFEEAMAEVEKNDPVKKQAAALDNMTHSIKELNKILSFKNPFDALASGLKKTLFENNNSRLRKLFEDFNKGYEKFYTQGLNVDSKVINKAVEPFSKILDSIENILQGDNLTGLFTDTLGKVSNLLEVLLKKDFNKKQFSDTIKEIFSFKFLDQGLGLTNNLMEIGGNIVGNIVKGTFVLGEELSEALIAGIEYLSNNEALYKDFGTHAWFSRMLNKFFKISDGDYKEIIKPALESMKKLADKIVEKFDVIKTPIMNFFDTIARFFAEKLSEYVVPVLNNIMAKIPGLNIFSSNEGIYKYNMKNPYTKKEETFLENYRKDRTKAITDGMTNKNLSKREALNEFVEDQYSLFNDRGLNDQQQIALGSKMLEEAYQISKLPHMQGKMPYNVNSVNDIQENLRAGVGLIHSKIFKPDRDITGFLENDKVMISLYEAMIRLKRKEKELRPLPPPSVKAKDVFIETDKDDKHLFAKPGGFFDNMFGLFGNAMSPYNNINEEKESLQLYSKESKENYQELSRQLQGLRNDLKSQKIDVNMDGQKVANIVIKKGSDAKYMGRGFNETALRDTSAGELAIT